MDCPDLAVQPPQHCQAPWVAHNRQIALLALGMNQDYRETDTSGRTADGVFNAERGRVEGQGVRGRWQGEVALGALALPLWIELEASTLQGPSAYQGYWQEYDNTLTPLAATTRNQWQQTQVRVGLPLAVPSIHRWQANAQWLPYILIQNSIWTRDLEQYRETYTAQTTGRGVLLQGRLAAQWLGWVDGSVLDAGHTRVQAPSLAFDQTQYRPPQYRLAVGLSYAITPRWSLQTQWQTTDTQHQASAVQNGLQAPPSRQSQQLFTLGVGWHY